MAQKGSKEVVGQPSAIPLPVRAQERGPRFLTSICARSLLSFGPETDSLELGSLNVLVGPNGSGKSNFLDLLDLLRDSAVDSYSVGGKSVGSPDWMWKGGAKVIGSLDVTVASRGNYKGGIHRQTFVSLLQSFFVTAEEVGDKDLDADEGATLYRNAGVPPAYLRTTQSGVRSPLLPVELRIYNSILSQIRDPGAHPEITYLATNYSKIRLYREWEFGREAVFRVPQKADLRRDRLEEDFSNLGLVLNRLQGTPKVKGELISRLKDLYEGLVDFNINVEGGTVQVLFTEGDFTVPATRLSDGSLRYLCLLAILCDPEPPPLIGIEEPELGFHPDLIPKIADLLVEASKRTQLIVTTHSDILVDALSERPESVVVCEKHDGKTKMQRLNRDDLAEWLQSYRLGELWTRGHIGGTRW